MDTSPLLAQLDFMGSFVNDLGSQLGSFLPSLLGAIAILIVGWLVATIVAAGVKNLLNRTNLDDKLANWVMGQSLEQDVPIEQWTATLIYWVIMTFTLVAFLNALNLEVVSAPLNNFLQQIFQYLPRVGGALVLAGLGWLVATLVKLVVTRGLLSRFNLDDRLAAQVGAGEEGKPFLVNETIGTILYWFILLFFLPLVLDALELPGLLQPVQALIDQFLSAVPKIFTAAIVLGIGWLVANAVKSIVTNLVRATNADQLGARFGLSATEEDGVSLSSLAGTVVYVLILLPAVVSALNELDIQAISEPAVAMLEQILTAIPQILMAGLVLVIFYVIGQFVSDLVSSILTSVGFNNIFTVLGLPELSFPAAETAETVPDAEGQPSTKIQSPGRTPAEIVGLIVLVAVVLFGVITATEILQFAALTDIVRAVLRVASQVLSGVVVFAVGLYFANLAFRLIANMQGAQANTLAQTARISIIALVGAMALQQMGVATNIVNLAFGLLLGAVAVAIAIAFGLGGRDVASEQLREWLGAFKQGK
ncbi:MAG: mechanosensitive ion channel [Leptolyngbyaceae cyanobacterium MO_188.B28]|nr:mechanosensitive ion channel [Leptolyngbyaceae cyanobacterium MO_188.B28]